jgi:serine/threonine protein kinase
MPFAEGENIGAYRILEQLGQGGMATVYKAYHAALDRYVALKVLHPAFKEDPNFEARFQREARLVAKLDHPSIVPIFDYAEQENRPYLVMKYIEGETLKARLARGPLSSQEINQVVNSVGAALAYAHKQGVLHRDIKPSNVLISKDGQMYLADFGLARIAQAGESTLSSDSIMGTPQYISPEQARGDKNLDEGTDIYSFGVMLYELVVGQVPFSADTPFSIIHDHIYTPLPLPRSFNKDVPESVERVLLKALAKERKDRFADIPTMVKAFKEAWAMAGVPMVGTSLTLPTPKVEPEKKEKEEVSRAEKTVLAKEAKKKRSPWPYLAAGILLIVCCAFGFLAVRQGRLNNLAALPTATRVIENPTPPEPAPRGPTVEVPRDLPPEVLNAQRRVDENPGDPIAHLDLTLAYWDAGLQRQAYETLNEAANLADRNSGFFIEAGHQLTAREAWIGAAAMYLRAIKLIKPNGEVPDDLMDNFHEAVYKAALKPELEEIYPLIDEIKNVDEPIGLVAQARRTYFLGKEDEGRRLLDQVKRLKPGLAESILLEGEFAIKERRLEDAKVILLPLQANLDTPEWIRIMTEDMLNRIP